jgi:hydroxypyruvate reductase
MTVTEIALESLHSEATEIFREALDACNIESAFDRRLRFEGNKLHRLIKGGDGPSVIDLKAYKSIDVIAIGKAAVPMLETLMKRMDRRLGLRGVCCSGEIPDKRNWRIRYFEGGHPLPNEGSFAAARATLALLRKARKDTLVIFLISGGASALFDLPLDADISLEDTMAFHQALIASGAPITEVNTIRKHFSAVKGGRLAMAASEATKLNILRSLDTLASGPTSPDHTTVEEVLSILAKYDLLAKFPAAVRAFFERADLPESPGNKTRRGPFLPRLPWSERTEKSAQANEAQASTAAEDAAFRDSMFEVLLSSHDLVENARTLAEQAGYHTVVDNACDDWDYADASRYLLQRFHALRAEHPRCCLISGGEVTVTLDRTPGAGGRNMQFVLQSALELAHYPSGSTDDQLIVFSAGSDGIDGNTRSAGAIADTTTVQRARAFGYKPEKALEEFDACPLLTALGDSVVTGPTGHNLRDLRLLISHPA